MEETNPDEIIKKVVKETAPVTQAVAQLINVIECEANKFHTFYVTFKKTHDGRILIENNFNLVRVEPFYTETILMTLCPEHYYAWCQR